MVTFFQKNRLTPVLALALLVAVGWFLLHWWSVGRFQESTDNAYIEAGIVSLAPQVSGRVIEVAVVQNQAVQQGDLLLRIDPRDYQAKRDQAHAEWMAAQAAQTSLHNQIELQQALIQQAQAERERRQAERERARDDLQRYQALAAERAASRQQLESAVAVERQAAAAELGAEAALLAEQQRLRLFQAQLSEAEADLQAAQAELALAELDLEYTTLRAPTAGVIGNKHVEVGQYLREGTQVASLVPLQQVHITANFKETQVGQMTVGQPVSIEVDAYPDSPLTGVVESFAPASGSRFSLLPTENATGNFTKIVQRIPVRIALPASYALQGLLRPGMSVVVSVDTRQQESARG